MHAVGQYQLDIFCEETFERGSSDNSFKYDFEYFKQSEFLPTTIIGIKVFKNGELYKSAVVGADGGGTGIHKTSTIVENTRIVTCCSDSVFCLSLPDLSLLWMTQADTATCFEIFKYKDSYIVHGELDISMLDNDGKILWQRSGADIFTTLGQLDEESDFQLAEDHIVVRDYYGRVYKFNYKGEDNTDMSQFSWLK